MALGLVFLQGAETRAGKIGKTRVLLAADPATAGSDPIVLQWTVNGVPAGSPVTLPWTVLTPTPTTVAQVVAVVAGTPVNFKNVVWKAGDVVLLQITLGALVSLTQTIFTAVFEKNYAP